MTSEWKKKQLKDFSKAERKTLCTELREEILTTVRHNGGHLASNLGVIEATVALHTVFSFPKDKIVFDVGHQCYAHKLLSGRESSFSTLRKFGGISGFPKRGESPFDSYDTGHAGTAISAALGIAKARDLSGGDEEVIAFVGDGSFVNGLVYEALNSLSILKTRILILLNDNGMSISPTVGGAHDIFSGDEAERVRVLESFGLTYLGVADGNDVEEMISALSRAKEQLKTTSVLLHISTKKGAGYAFSEENPTLYHGVSPDGAVKEYGIAAAETLCSLAKTNEKIAVITAAMTDNLGLRSFFDAYPERAFDVGICEEHALVFSSALASRSFHTYYAIFSTFLERAFDEIIHDVACQDLPVTFLIDRAGVSGADGETHQGVFDLSYLSLIPNLVIGVPKNRKELQEMVTFSATYSHPLAIRYPRSGTNEEDAQPVNDFSWQEIFTGTNEKGIFLCAGERAISLAKEVNESLFRPLTIVNARFIKPLDEEFLRNIQAEWVYTIEDNVLLGGFGEKVKAFFGEKKKVNCFAYPDRFLPQGSVKELMNAFGLNAKEILSVIQKNEG